MPDRKTMTKPENAIKTDVPRSGCLKISAVGKNTRTRDAIMFALFNGIEPDAIYLATTNGIAILSNSDG